MITFYVYCLSLNSIENNLNEITRFYFFTNTDGTKERLDIEKLVSHLETLCYDLNKAFVNPVSGSCVCVCVCSSPYQLNFISFVFMQRMIADQVIKGSFDGVNVPELINLQAETAATMTVDHSDYSLLAGRIVMANLHKQTKSKFSGMQSFVCFEKMRSICFVFIL